MCKCNCDLNLKDGECYQFNYAGSTLKGFYRKDTGRLYHTEGFIHASVVGKVIKLTANDLNTD